MIMKSEMINHFDSADYFLNTGLQFDDNYIQSLGMNEIFLFTNYCTNEINFKKNYWELNVFEKNIKNWISCYIAYSSQCCIGELNNLCFNF